MISLDEALSLMQEQLPFPQDTEEVHISQAFGRICAKAVISTINAPAFDNSAMDGYAIKHADLQNFAQFKVIGQSLAGEPFVGEWQAGSAVRIMTGAMLPQGFDTVIMQEFAKEKEGEVSFTKSPKQGENVRYLGEEIKAGDVVLTAGAKLNARTLPLLASLGVERIKVYRKVKVVLFSTGSELVNVGTALQTGQIYDLNRFSVNLMLQQLGCEVVDLGILSDDPALFSEQFAKASQQGDLIITSGGVSIGKADFTKQVLEKLGKINFWKIAIKPGKPFAFGKIGKAWFCGLPGNPVSALVTFYQIVQPAIAKLSGRQNFHIATSIPAKAKVLLKKKAGRLDFQRGFYSVNSEGEVEVESVGFQGSHLFSNFVRSNCFIVLEVERGNVEAGETVTIQPFNAILD